MASSGLIQGSVSQNTSYYRAFIYWKINSQDYLNNTSNVTVEVLVDTTTSSMDWDGTVSEFVLSVNGTVWRPSNFNSDSNSGWTYSAATSSTGRYAERIYTVTLNIPHDVDGGKTAAMSCSFSLNSGGYGPGNVNISGSADLTDIPRASTITTFSDFTIGNNIPVALDRKVATYTDNVTLKVGDTVVKTLTNVSTSFTITLSTAEQDIIYNATPNSASVTVTLYCTTYNGATELGTTNKNAIASVDASFVPTFTSLTAAEAVANVASIVGKYVQNLSRITFTINGATGIKGSTIAGYKIVFDGVTYSTQTATTGVVSKSGTLTATATITDSRGRTATKSINATLLAYIPPQITTFTVARCNADGAANTAGIYAKVVGVGSVSSLINSTERNSLTYAVYSKVRGTESWTQKKTLLVAGLSLNVTDIFSGFDALLSYDFRLDITDKFNTTISINILPIGQVTISLSKDGIGVGKAWEHGSIDAAGDIYEVGTKLSEKYLGKAAQAADSGKLGNQLPTYYAKATPPSCKVYHNTAQSIGSNQDTVLAFNSEKWKSDAGIHSKTTNNSRLVAPLDGKYTIEIHVSWSANTSGFRALVIRKNGTTKVVEDARGPAPGGYCRASISTPVDLLAGEYVEVVVWHNATSSLSIEYTGDERSPFFSLIKESE